MSSNYGYAPNSSNEIVSSAIILGIVVITAFAGEIILKASTDKTIRSQTLLDYTASSQESNVIIRQNFVKFPEDAIPLGLSVNERSGVEFSYSFYLYVMPSTFNGEQKLKHVFHKGYGLPWPLMAPGVFIHGHTNSMRVVMNTSKNPYTYVDVKNIPVGKWFHVVLNCFKGGLDVYVNGNLASRIPFVNAVPYQNYQDVLFFSQPNFRFLGAQIAALGEENIEIQGAFDGMLSSMKYARYALSMNEITKLMNEGPSTKRKSAAIATPPYLADTWWAQQRA